MLKSLNTEVNTEPTRLSLYQRKQFDSTDLEPEDSNLAQVGYEKSTVPRVHDFKEAENGLQAGKDEVYLDYPKKGEKLATYGKGYLTRVPGFSGQSQAQYELTHDSHNFDRRYQRIEDAIHNGVIPEEMRDMYVSGELKLPRGRNGGRKPKAKTTSYIEPNQTVTEKVGEENA